MGHDHDHGHGAAGVMTAGARHRRRLMVAFVITLVFTNVQGVTAVATASTVKRGSTASIGR